MSYSESRMSHTEWLRRQVERLEDEIRQSTVFETDLPASQEQLAELRTKVVLHTYLRQQLLRRDTTCEPMEEVDTQEFEIVPKR